METEAITFSFGKNWRDFVETVSEESIERARVDIENWLGRESIVGKTVLDIGSGSGIHSLCFYLLGAKEVFSLDVDPFSVESTQLLWKKAGSPSNWTVVHGSILDADFVARLGKHEIVYSWGVLHHTGSMWEAIDNTCSLVENGGRLWIAIYQKNPSYPQQLALKQSYNRASKLGKKMIEWREIYKIMKARRTSGQNPFAWNEKRQRGMDTHHDLLDWLGGLPYEVATRDEIVTFCQDRGLKLERVDDNPDVANFIYLFSLQDPS